MTDLPTRSVPFADFRLPSPWLMAAVLALASALFLPKNNPFPYKFEVGKNWNYPDLKAPFDFEVKRAEAEVADQLANLEKESIPCFLMDGLVAQQQKRLFQKEFDERIQKSKNDTQFAELVANRGAYLNFSMELLDGIFSKGIVGGIDSGEWNRRAQQPVLLIKNTTENRQPLGQLFTLESAHEFLTDTLPFSKLANPEFLLPLFEESLAPNVRQSDSLTLLFQSKKRDALLKTGIFVQKGDLIAQRGQPVSAEIFLKLSSLNRRFDPPNRTFQLLGYLALASLASIALALLVLIWFPEKWDDRRQSLLVFASVFAMVLIFSGFARAGDGLALLTPTLLLLFFLHQFFQKDLVWMAWLLTILHTGLALDWSFGWVVIQLAGGFTVLLFPRRVFSWRGRGIVAGTTASVMTAAWLGVILAGKISRAAVSWEVLIFIWLSVFGSLAAFPMARFFRKLVEKPV